MLDHSAEPRPIGWRFADLVARKRLSKIRLHDLRHSYPTFMLEAGTDLKSISSALGHSMITVTGNTYVHVTDALQRSHADRLEASLGGVFAAAPQTVISASVPQSRHAATRDTKKPRRSKVSVVAPAGFEPALPP